MNKPARPLQPAIAKKAVVLSIKPEYAALIYDTSKVWEFRKNAIPLHVDVYLYESAPVSMITGKVRFTSRFDSCPFFAHQFAERNDIFQRHGAGISLSALEEYANGSNVSAHYVGTVERFAAPVKLLCRPPQNFGSYALSLLQTTKEN